MATQNQNTELCIKELVINGQINAINRQRVHAELVNALKHCTTLHPSLQSYIDNMGNESLLITLTGTVPMLFGGRQYNTPVNIFLPTEYPAKPPLVFVRPNSKMVVNANHPNVNRNGECNHAYFARWDPSSCNLVGCIKTLSDDFSKIPPLLTKSSAAQPPVQRPVQPQQSPGASQYGYSGGYNPAVSPSMAPTTLGHHAQTASVDGNVRYPYQPPQAQQPSKPVPNPSPLKELTPREKLAAKVRGRIARDSAPAVDLQKRLYEAEVDLTRELSYLQEMEKMLPQISKETEEVKAACDAESSIIEAELNEFTALKDGGGSSALASTVVPVNGFSEQALTEMAKRDALEDVMYELMRRMSAENCDSVLKLIRNAACDQFVSVALLDRIEKTATGHIRTTSNSGRV